MGLQLSEAGTAERREQRWQQGPPPVGPWGPTEGSMQGRTDCHRLELVGAPLGVNDRRERLDPHRMGQASWPCPARLCGLGRIAFPSLCLSFLIRARGIITVPNSEGCWEN